MLDSSLCQWNLDSGFRIVIFSGIPDSLSCIPDSTWKFFLDFGFHKQNFSGLQNPDSPYMHGANWMFLFLPSKQKGLLLRTFDNKVSALARLLFVRICWLGKKQVSVVRIIKRVELREMARPFPRDKEKVSIIGHKGPALAVVRKARYSSLLFFHLYRLIQTTVFIYNSIYSLTSFKSLQTSVINR